MDYTGQICHLPADVNETAGENTGFNLEEIHSVSPARHDHVSLVFLVNGQQTMNPEGIDINPQLWHDHTLDKYGLSGLSPMHTHNNSDTFHV